MKLIDFWPPNDSDHSAKCFFTEAETASPAVFLAVHRPMTLQKEVYGSDGIEPELETEEDVLRAFLDPDPESGTLVAPIIGDSGVGKSHMIAWLDANLRMRSDSDSRHIVRIPKSASLRTVLDRILEGLLDKQYKDLKQEIATARLPPTLQKATGLLEIGLRNELQLLGQEAAARIKGDEAKPGDKERKAHCTQNALVALLHDPGIQGYFSSHDGDESEWGVLTRIADRCLNGSKKTDDGPLNEFFESDFDFIQNIDTQDLAAPTKNYLRMVRTIPDGIKLIVAILNEVIDRALSDLIDIGSMTLADIFQDIRKRLLKEGKELVVLVEDFAVLAGIQGPLLTAMVQEANPGGKQTLCTMRTALAVTEGRIMEETVMTRAKVSWKIQTRPFESNEEALEVFEDFIGGYLNAARFGAEKLEKSFKKRDIDKGLHAWVPNFYLENADRLDDSDRAQLDAFEKSPTLGHPLFPLNPGAIRQLTKRYSGDATGYRFEPRKLIHFLLRETVGKSRSLFEKGAFPYPEFHQLKFASLSLDLQPVLQSQAQPDDLSRLATTVYFWGDDPESPGHAANLKEPILECFQLPKIDWGAKPKSMPKAEKGAVSKNVGGNLGAVEFPKRGTDPVEGAKSKTLLDKWQKEETINQASANLIRTLLENGINSWIDSSALLEKEVKVSKQNIYIPLTDQGARDADNAVVVVARDEDLKDPGKLTDFFSDMRSLLRNKEKPDWNYEGGEEDCARYANLIERLTVQLAEHAREVGPEKFFTRSHIQPLAKALLLDARLLNLKGASSNKDEDNLNAMLADGLTSGITGPPADDHWIRIKEGSTTSRRELKSLLLKHISSRQGGGGDTQAVDASVLLPAIRELRASDWRLDDDAEIDWSCLESPVARSHIKELRVRLPVIVANRAKEVSSWCDEMTNAFGHEFEWRDVQERMRDVVTKANRVGVFRNRDLNADSLKSRIMNTPSILETLKEAKRLSEGGAEFGKSLSILAGLDEALMRKSQELINAFKQFLQETGGAVDQSLLDSPQDLDGVAGNTEQELQELSDVWNDITKLCE